MAVYSVSSSGNLKFADTGLGSPVSFFAYQGFGTNALAGGPLTGQLAKVWVIPTSNRFTSAGRLRLSGTLVKSQSSIAASAIGESPTAGGDNSSLAVFARLGFVAGLESSSGNLKLTGSSSVVKAYKITSSGNLKTTGTVSSPATVQKQSAGNLKIPGSTLARAIFATSSTGSMTISGLDLFNDIVQTTSAGSLTITGTTDSHKAYGKVSEGQLTATTSSSSIIIFEPNSNGNLVLTTKTYDPSYQGGVSTNSIASIYEDLPATLRTTVTSFYGDIHSSGSLTITPIGEVVTSLSYSSGIAGSALAETALAGGIDTERRASTFTTFYAPTSSGLLHIQGPSTSIQYDNDTAGNLTISGSTTPAFNLGFLTDGNLSTSGDNITVRTLNFDSSGNILLPDTNGFTNASLSDSSGIAGSAIASTPIGGSSDYYEAYHFAKTLGYDSIGNLTTVGAVDYTKTLDFISEGYLTIIGITGTGQQNLVLSEGFLSTSGDNITVRTLHFDSAGDAKLTDVSGYVTSLLGDSSGIAGSALAAQPIGSGIDLYKGFDFVRNLGFPSEGSLVTNGDHVSDRTLNFDSTGYLTISGYDVFEETEQPTSAGVLAITGQSEFASTLHFDSAGNIIAGDTNGYTSAELSDSSGIAGSAIAATPIGGSSDYYKAYGFQTSLNFDSEGNIVANGSTSFSKSLDFLSEGYLTVIGITGSGNQSLVDSAGNLITSGDNITVRTLHLDSSGNIVASDTGYKVGGVSLDGAIAGSAIASGNTEFSAINVALANGRQSAGNLVTVNDSIAVRTLGFDSYGDFTITGYDSIAEVWAEDDPATNILTWFGSSTHNTTWAPTSIGVETFTDITLTSQNAIAASALGEFPLGGDTDNLVGTNVVYVKGSPGQTSAGLLTISGSFTYVSSTLELSNGNLVVSGSTNTLTVIKPKTAGNLKITSTSVHNSTVLPRTAGNLVIRSNKLGSLIIVKATTSGELVTTGTVGSNLLVSRDTTGELRLITESIAQINVTASTRPGNLTFTDHWYDRTASGAGLAVNGIAAGPIAGAEENTIGTLRTTVVNYVGPRVSTGRLTISPTGALIINDLGPIASGAIATTSLDGSTTSGRLASRVSYISRGVSYSDHVFYVTSSGTLKLTGSSALSKQTFLITSAGQLRLTNTTQSRILIQVTSSGMLHADGYSTNSGFAVYPVASHGRVNITGATAHNSTVKYHSSSTVKLSGTSVHSSTSHINSTGSIGIIGAATERDLYAETSAGSINIAGTSTVETTLVENTSGSINISTESKYNIISIISSIGSVGILGGIEESTATGERTAGRIKVSGKTDIVISIKPGSRGFTLLRGESKTQSILNKENMGGSGIYYGPWGAPFVLPFAKEWEEVDGKRRRKINRLQVAIRFSRGDRWTRTHYNLNKMNHGVTVAASALRPTQSPSVATAPISTIPKITVNASALRLIQTRTPNVDLTNFNVVESQKVKVQDFTEKSTLVETGSIKQNNYRINATVDVDTTSFKVTVALPKSTVDA